MGRKPFIHLLDNANCTARAVIARSLGQRRNVVVKNVKAYDDSTLMAINSNKGDIATIQSTCATSVKDISFL
ncbi:hypothetical protein F5Y02DRAFT_358913 [Annulohypoxylon stygium]|nr:hypothetical protein F5Y02DRAFT_358913 [Annulohypoxylon stygium]